VIPEDEEQECNGPRMTSNVKPRVCFWRVARGFVVFDVDILARDGRFLKERLYLSPAVGSGQELLYLSHATAFLPKPLQRGDVETT
jgi:hypothetical protein